MISRAVLREQQKHTVCAVCADYVSFEQKSNEDFHSCLCGLVVAGCTQCECSCSAAFCRKHCLRHLQRSPSNSVPRYSVETSAQLSLVPIFRSLINSFPANSFHALSCSALGVNVDVDRFCQFCFSDQIADVKCFTSALSCDVQFCFI